MDNNNYLSSAIVTFPSEGDYKLWSEKFALFNTDKAIHFSDLLSLISPFTRLSKIMSIIIAICKLFTIFNL